ncbi:unnamed protein product [Rotaria sp. Silwood2]|nr:unnamed protein product [Rotaria sp. Silwood2]CAF3060108.1 unnamed protein product [Rotaria sp. Silwood2]CAF3321236.1 unnamed protein product [Rotaria sp. Silwood2]CAF3417733.1 unnamed protein product [Rotaria sp. Silwood2]CAF4267869.1 unnamed protein product [Rotaria sp. Silwood2]
MPQKSPRVLHCRPTTTTASAINLFEKPIRAWKSDDLAHWFQQNRILPKLCTLYDFDEGSELLNYYNNISTDEKSNIQYQIYSQAYSQENNGKILLPHQFARFVTALRKLYIEHDLKSKTAAAQPVINSSSKFRTRNSSRIPRRSSLCKIQQ